MKAKSPFRTGDSVIVRPNIHDPDLAWDRRVSRVEQLAARFVAANAAVIALARGCRSAQWQAPCADDGRSIGVVAHHVAETNAAFTTIMAQLVAGETDTRRRPPWPRSTRRTPITPRRRRRLPKPW